MTRYFEYGDEAVDYLKSRDVKLGAAIDAIGHVQRELEENGLFSGIVHCIVGQQISSVAQKTVWKRMLANLGEVAPATVCGASLDELQACGITYTKAGYIKAIAEKIASGEFDLDAVEHMDDDAAIEALSSLPGIGTWTAEMLLLFNLARPDILSFGDLAIQRGMRMVYHHRKITRPLFEKYRRRYSPYGSVASFYLWAVSHGGVPGFDRDYAPKTEAQKKAARKKRAATICK